MREPPVSLSALQLGELPEFDPPPDLWLRIEQRQRQRRQRRFAVAGIAAAACLAAVMLLVPRPTVSERGGLADLQHRSHELEAQLAMLGSTTPAAWASTESELQRIEMALQQAYDRGAAATELEPLWRQRNDVLGALIAVQGQGALVTRI